MPREKALFTGIPSNNGALSAGSYQMIGSVFTPTIDIDVAAVYVAFGGAANAQPYIFNETTKELVSTGPKMPNTNYTVTEYTKMPLTAPVKLLKDQPYLIAIYTTNNYSLGLSDNPGTYVLPEGPGLVTAPPAILKSQNTTGYPASTSGFAKYLTAGVSVLLPLDPIFEVISGYTVEARTPLEISYKINDPDNAAVKVVISAGNTILVTDNAPTNNLVKSFNMASLWGTLPYGAQTLTVEITNTFGVVITKKIPFIKLLPADAALIETATQLQQVTGRLKSDIAAVVALAGKPTGTSLADAIPNLGTWKYATGLSYPSATTVQGTTPTGVKTTGYRYIEASGLPFRPKLVQLTVQLTSDVRSLHVITMVDTPAPVTGNMGTAQVFAAYYYDARTGINSEAFRLDTTLNFFTENGFRIYAAGTAATIQYKWETWG